MENLVNVLVEKINSGRTVKFYWGEEVESFYIYENVYFNDYDGGYDELSLEELKSSIARAIEQGGYCPGITKPIDDQFYLNFNLTITRWLGAFGYGSDLKEAIKFEMSSPREKAGEFMGTGRSYGYDYEPFSSLFSNLVKDCQIGFIYNQSDVRNIYAKDVWSEVDENGYLNPTRGFDSLLQSKFARNEKEFWYNCLELQDDYNGHTEAFIKAFVRPRGIVIKGSSRKYLPFIMKTLKENGINIPIFLTRGCDSHLSVVENGKVRVIKYPY